MAFVVALMVFVVLFCWFVFPNSTWLHRKKKNPPKKDLITPYVSPSAFQTAPK